MSRGNQSGTAKWLRAAAHTGSLLALLMLPLSGLAAEVANPGGTAAPGPVTTSPAGAVSSFAPSEFLPQTLGFGSWLLGPLRLTPTLSTQVDGFAESNPGWGGDFHPPLNESRFFFEHADIFGLNAGLDLGEYCRLSARGSGIFSMSGGGLNAAATNYGDIQARSTTLEDAYLTWTSGDLFPGLGEDAVTVIAGRAPYQIGDGFLFYNGTYGVNKSAAWLAPRLAFKRTVVARITKGHLTAEGFYLSPNDEPDTHTRVAGVNSDLRLGEMLYTGFTYANIFRSDTPSRQGLNLFYWRGEGAPMATLPDFYLSSSFAAESNGNRVSGAYAWYITPSYTFSALPWSPILRYRYASFSGGGAQGQHDFDPLFYGMSDWGTWYQGEIAGNWIFSNSNLDSHQIRLTLRPASTVTLDLIYYHFMLDSRTQTLVPDAVVTNSNLSDEVDMILTLNVTKWWTIAVTFAVSVPDQGGRQLFGGSQTWFQSAIWSGWAF